MLYHDLRAGFSLDNGLRIGLGIDNVTDRDPPFLVNGGIANTDVATYRLLGRTWWLTALVLAMFCGVPAGTQDAPGSASRVEAVDIIADMRRIVTEEGVERLETAHIGGIDQWVSIRGMDSGNPVLLMLGRDNVPAYCFTPTVMTRLPATP